jgi:hypothetical protein
MRPRNGAVMQCSFPNANGNATLPVISSVGMSTGSWNTNLSIIRQWKNGVRLTDTTGLALTPILPTVSLCVGARNVNGVAAGFMVGLQYMTAIGAELSDVQELEMYNATSAYLENMGGSMI